MIVSQTYYYEVLANNGDVVCVTEDAIEALRALPVGGEINEVVKTVVKTVVESGPRTTITIVKDVVNIR